MSTGDEQRGYSRRRFLIGAAGTAFAVGAGFAAATAPLRIGLTPVILDDRTTFLGDWRDWLRRRMGLPVVFVQRAKYRDITDLLLNGHLDAAWICGYPYVLHRDRLRLVAVPEYRGAPRYRSLIISGSGRVGITAFEDLAGRVFAFSDPDSNSGYLYPSYRLRRLGSDPGDYFRRAFFTWSHRNTIEAVAEGLADGGAVDSYVWDAYNRLHPDLAAATRVIERSPEFGFPPLVTTKRAPPENAARLRDALLAMDADPAGRALLDRVFLDRFVRPHDASYDSIAGMARVVDSQ
ncbi:MAG TPA: ABC transporter substrate-binding protein [Chromatiaceae bacterium]|nr:ABC transporter substrate-binding protein [Chromatiaceae bacterium]